MENTGRIKAFILLEAVAASLILSIVSLGLAGTIIAQSKMSKQTSYRVEAINYARSAAEIILNNCARYASDYLTVFLGPGEHNANTDPSICALPKSYFKDALSGKMKYRVSELDINGPYGPVPMLRVDVLVEWRHNERIQEESLAFFINRKHIYINQQVKKT